MNDLIGDALWSFYKYSDKTEIKVKCSITEDDIIPIDYFFRDFDEMPNIEKKAIELCAGNVLDVGAAAGCHSIELKNRGLNVTSIDISKGATLLMKSRGLKSIEKNFYDASGRFDTLLFLMNGSGIAGRVDNLPKFLSKCKSLLKDKGQILIDSSNIIYMYEENDDAFKLNLNSNYYGELSYKMTYKDIETDWFDWLFIDFDLLSEYAFQAGLNCELIIEGEHYDYLARLTHK